MSTTDTVGEGEDDAAEPARQAARRRSFGGSSHNGENGGGSGANNNNNGNGAAPHSTSVSGAAQVVGSGSAPLNPVHTTSANSVVAGNSNLNNNVGNNNGNYDSNGGGGGKNGGIESSGNGRMTAPPDLHHHRQESGGTEREEWSEGEEDADEREMMDQQDKIMMRSQHRSEKRKPRKRRQSGGNGTRQRRTSTAEDVSNDKSQSRKKTISYPKNDKGSDDEIKEHRRKKELEHDDNIGKGSEDETMDVALQQGKVVEASPKGRYVRFNQKLGEGAYKKVYKAWDSVDGHDVAWNTVKLGALSENGRMRIIQEMQILNQLHHSHIIKFYASWISKENNSVVFITELITSGTLKDFIKERPIRLRTVKRWCKQILDALNYLHTRSPPVIHRDLKCDNIFINGSTSDIRIGDLGLASWNRRDGCAAQSVLGTPEYMAPELYEESYDTQVDIYAFGMCVLEMVSKEMPYMECNSAVQIYKKVTSGVLPNVFNRTLESPLKEYIHLCLKKPAPGERRPTAEFLMNHPFLEEDDEDDDIDTSDLISKKPAVRSNASHDDSEESDGGDSEASSGRKTFSSESDEASEEYHRGGGDEDDESAKDLGSRRASLNLDRVSEFRYNEHADDGDNDDQGDGLEHGHTRKSKKGKSKSTKKKSTRGSESSSEDDEDNKSMASDEAVSGTSYGGPMLHSSFASTRNKEHFTSHATVEERAKTLFGQWTLFGKRTKESHIYVIELSRLNDNDTKTVLKFDFDVENEQSADVANEIVSELGIPKSETDNITMLLIEFKNNPFDQDERESGLNNESERKDDDSYFYQKNREGEDFEENFDGNKRDGDDDNKDNDDDRSDGGDGGGDGNDAAVIASTELGDHHDNTDDDDDFHLDSDHTDSETHEERIRQSPLRGPILLAVDPSLAGPSQFSLASGSNLPSPSGSSQMFPSGGRTPELESMSSIEEFDASARPPTAPRDSSLSANAIASTGASASASIPNDHQGLIKKIVVRRCSDSGGQKPNICFGPETVGDSKKLSPPNSDAEIREEFARDLARLEQESKEETDKIERMVKQEMERFEQLRLDHEVMLKSLEEMKAKIQKKLETARVELPTNIELRKKQRQIVSKAGKIAAQIGDDLKRHRRMTRRNSQQSGGQIKRSRSRAGSGSSNAS